MAETQSTKGKGRASAAQSDETKAGNDTPAATSTGTDTPDPAAVKAAADAEQARQADQGADTPAPSETPKPEATGANAAEGQVKAAPQGGSSNHGRTGPSPVERAQTTAEDDTAKERVATFTRDTTNHGTAPIDPPQTGDRRPPVEGIRHLSTSPVAAAAGQRSLIGQGHLGLVDDEGDPIDPDSIFDYGDGTVTFAVVTQRVHESYVQANSKTAITRLLFPAGARIPRDRAAAFVEAAKAEAEEPLTAAPGMDRHAPIPGEVRGDGGGEAVKGADTRKAEQQG